MDYREIVKIEAAAYNSGCFCVMEDCESMEDIAEYCECELKDLLVLGESGWWYGLVAVDGDRAEFADLAKVPGSPKLDWKGIWKSLKEAGISTVTCDMRETTSYKVFTRMLKLFGWLYGIRIIEDTPYYDDEFEETMHKVVVSWKLV